MSGGLVLEELVTRLEWLEAWQRMRHDTLIALRERFGDLQPCRLGFEEVLDVLEAAGLFRDQGGLRCCERDTDGDGNCDRHPTGTVAPLTAGDCAAVGVVPLTVGVNDAFNPVLPKVRGCVTGRWPSKTGGMYHLPAGIYRSCGEVRDALVEVLGAFDPRPEPGHEADWLTCDRGCAHDKASPCDCACHKAQTAELRSPLDEIEDLRRELNELRSRYVTCVDERNALLAERQDHEAAIKELDKVEQRWAAEHKACAASRTRVAELEEALGSDKLTLLTELIELRRLRSALEGVSC